MKRRLAAFAATLAVTAGILTATSPSAWAIRDTGWVQNSCPVGTQQSISVWIRIVWYASDNHRLWEMQGEGVDSLFNTHDLASLNGWVKSLEGNWTWVIQNLNPPVPPGYVYGNYTPMQNPAEGHYFLARANWSGVSCDVQVFN